MRGPIRRLAGLLTVWLAAGAQILSAADGNFAVVSNPGDAPALLKVVINGEKTAVALAAGQWVLISEATASADGFACTLYFPESHLLREDLMDVRIQVADTRRLSFSYSPFADDGPTRLRPARDAQMKKEISVPSLRTLSAKLIR